MFSSDPAVAKQQMLAIVFLLTAFGHMDGKFALSEKRFVQEKIARLVEERMLAAKMDPLARQVAIERATQQFQRVAAKIDREIAVLFTESVAEGETTEQFVYAKLALRCYELLRPFDDDARTALFEIVGELIEADGVVHPEEARLRDDIQRLLDGADRDRDGGGARTPSSIAASRWTNPRCSSRARTTTRSSRAKSASTRATRPAS